MTRVREVHWALAFLLAVTLHLASYIWLTSGPAGPLELAPERARGGGSFGATGDRGAVVSQLLVSLGAAQSKPDQPAPATAAPRAEASQPAAPELPAVAEPAPQEPEAAVEDPAPEAAQADPAPVAARVPEPDGATSAPVAPPEPKVVSRSPPTPRRKPEQPPAPEVELLEERLPVQGPSSAPPVPPAQEATQVVELVQSASEGRRGTAGLESDGQVPELNYKEQVVLWLKRYGGYPRDAFRFRQEGVVLLHFVIDRRGRVLVYNIRKSSGYHLLDQAVKQMMERASPVPPIPRDIQLAKMEFTVPVRFIRD